jgi:transposase-like protein
MTEPADLPRLGTKRWTPHRKASVVVGINRGIITAEEACRRYGLTQEELSAWRKAFQRYGIGGLRTTRVIRRQE